MSLFDVTLKRATRDSGTNDTTPCTADDTGHEQRLLQQVDRLRRMETLLCEHDKRARELGIDEQQLARVRKALKMTPGPTPKGAMRILTWNLLANGLADDGFLMKDVLRKDLPNLPSDDLMFEAMVDEVSTVKRERGDMQALKAKFDTPRSRVNHAAVVDWKRRWLLIRTLIVATGPDIIALQELDHMADAEKELGALGYACSLAGPRSGSAYRPIHQELTGEVRREDKAFLAHLKATGVAFVPKTFSNCRKFGLKKNPDADDDGVAIFWRAKAFQAKSIDFLSFDDAKRNQVPTCLHCPEHRLVPPRFYKIRAAPPPASPTSPPPPSAAGAGVCLQRWRCPQDQGGAAL
jgi:hypothetical protein